MDGAHYFLKLQGLKQIKTGLECISFELNWTAGCSLKTERLICKTCAADRGLTHVAADWMPRGSPWLAWCTMCVWAHTDAALWAESTTHGGPVTYRTGMA